MNSLALGLGFARSRRLEQLTNGNFTQNVDGWTNEINGTTEWVADYGGGLRINAATGGGQGRASQQLDLVVGREYQVQATAARDGSSNWRVLISTSNQRSDAIAASSVATDLGISSVDFSFTAISGDLFILLAMEDSTPGDFVTYLSASIR